MKSFPKISRFLTLTGVLVASTSPARACSVCGCSLSTDWGASGYSATTPVQADVRFDYSDQSDLRDSTRSVDRSAFTFPNSQEIQQETVNRALWFDADFTPANQHWGILAQLPWFDRFHSTVAPGDTQISSAAFSGLGDLRLEARYQEFNAMRSWNVEAGFKLPTGRTNVAFDTGPQEGQLIDPGLQPGSGTWDFLASAAYFSRLGRSLGWFAQATLDAPLAQHNGYLPSPSAGVSAGVRWLNTSDLVPQFQLNARVDGREGGINGDRADSGGGVVYASPGATLALGPASSVFAFVQVPVYQRWNGLQLEPRWLLSTGFRFRY
jgi:hypothetical protein